MKTQISGLLILMIIFSIRVNATPVVTNVYDDTVLQLTLRGADCPFADHADYGIYIPTRKEQLLSLIHI